MKVYQTALLSLCNCILLWDQVSVSGEVPITRCGTNHTLKSNSLILYELQGQDAFVNVWSPYGHQSSGLPVWTVDVTKSNVTSQEIERALIRHYSGLTVYHMETSFNNTMLQCKIPSVNGDSLYTSGSLTLRTGYAPRVSNESLLVINAVVGRRMPKTCFGITGSPMPTYSLLKILNNNSAITIDAFRYQFHADCLQMELLTHQDNGLYQVVAENCFGKDFLNFSLLIFEMHPSIKIGFPITDKKSLRVHQGTNVVVGYDVGSPVLKTTWFYEGEHFLNNSRKWYNWTHLVVDDVSISDAGLYTIVVENSVGSGNAHFSLLVQSETPTIDDRSDCSELWGVTGGVSIISGLIGALISALVMVRKMTLLKKTRTPSDDPLSSNSGYCEMHNGRKPPTWVRPYSISKMPGCLEVPDYCSRAPETTTTDQVNGRRQGSPTILMPDNIPLGAIPPSSCTFTCEYMARDCNREPQQIAIDNAIDHPNNSRDRGYSHGYINVPDNQNVESELISSQ